MRFISSLLRKTNNVAYFKAEINFNYFPQLYPEDRVMDMFVTDEAHRAYSYNSFFEVRPMSSYVEKEKDIMAAFDIITYKRAACVIRMFHHAFRQKTFVRAISSFLEK